MGRDQREPDGVTLGMLLTGRGLSSLPRDRRLRADGLMAVIGFLAAVAVALLFDVDGLARGATVVAVVWLTVALVRYGSAPR